MTATGEAGANRTERRAVMDETQLELVAFIAAGGAIGSVARYGVSGLFPGNFPWGTFVVNLTGTFLLGFLYYLSLGRGALSPDGRAFLFIGIFGGYTTLSTFGLETVNLFRGGGPLLSLLNVGLNGGVCVLGAFLGAALGLLLG
jgi:fluoride exporter